MFPSLPERAFVLQNAFGYAIGSPRFLLLPTPTGVGVSWQEAERINNSGEIAGAYYRA